MKKTLLFTLLAFISAFSVAQVTIQTTGDAALQVSMQHSDQESTTLQYTISAFNLKEVTVEGERYHQLQLGNTSPLLEAGCPEVRTGADALIIPDNGWMQVEVIAASYQDFPDINLIPSKGNLTRDINPDDVPLIKGPLYQQNRFYPGELATLRDPYILRDFRGQTLVVQPFQYNPVTRVLRVFYSFTVKVAKAGLGGLNVLDRSLTTKASGDEFIQIYQRHFINFGALGINYTPVGEDGKMLVISHGAFMPAMADFVTWKNQRGIPCQMVDVATIGTTAAAIKTYVTNYYNTNGLTYLLLVGDATQIPTNSLTAGHSDNAYAYILGNDHYPEFFVGRFSAETIDHVETQVVRTLSYEIAPDTTGSWLRKSIGIASEEGPGDDNEYDYQHIRNMQTDLMNFSQNVKMEFFEGSQGGNDAPGDPTATMVLNAVNGGGGVILYTGHGSNTSWGTSGFSNTDVASLSNYNKWPYIWAVACVNGNFVGNTCFAEAWMRAFKSDQPTGAIAFLGSTINQSWDPPMDGQDEMVDILVESYATNIKRTFGGLSMSGCMKMNDSYGAGGYEMTDTWTLFGDPSLLVYTSSPLPITASHQPAIMIGTSQFPVFCPVNGAKATLSYNGQILGTGIVAGSTVTINFNSPLVPDTLLLVITGFNRIPYIAEIPLIVANAPYVTYKDHQVSDPNANNNNRADFGELISLNMSLENIGVQVAGQVNAVLRSLDSYVEVVDSTSAFGNINDGATQQVLNAFSVRISDSVPDGHPAAMQLLISDNNSHQWTANFTLVCHAPELLFDSLYFDDVAGGNGNGKFEPGEVVVLNARLKNIGGAEADMHTCNVLATSMATQLFGSDTVTFTQLPLQTPYNVQFYARMDTAVPLGTAFQFQLHFESGYYDASATIGDVVNSGNENWETGDFTKFNWLLSGDANWSISNSLPYEGIYCAKSGLIGNSAQSNLSVDWFAAFPDSVSFWLKVSCENGSASGQKWDYLEFYIDGVSKGWWDGTKPWMRVAYPVSAGQHTFTWQYEKDAYATGGSDAAWIDLITFPAAGNAVLPKPFILMDFAHYSDVNGNNNYVINPGELIDISCKLTNIGFAQATNISGALAVNDPLMTLVDPLGTFGSLASGADTVSGNEMQVQVSSGAPAGKVFTLHLTLTDDSANTWVYPMTMEVDASTGVNEINTTAVPVVYPNPFSNLLNLFVPGETGKIRVQMFTMDGRLVLDQEAIQGESVITLDTQKIPSGALLVRVFSKDAVYTVKVIRN